MALLRLVLLPFQAWNDVVLRIGWWIAVFAIGLMVLSILLQVFFRYVLGNPLAWSEEAARFCMLWMTGFMAPLAYRQGGFVAIEMLIRFLPARVGEILSFLLLVIALVVLVVALPIGWGEVTGFSSKFADAGRDLASADRQYRADAAIDHFLLRRGGPVAADPRRADGRGGRLRC